MKILRHSISSKAKKWNNDFDRHPDSNITKQALWYKQLVAHEQDGCYTGLFISPWNILKIYNK
jgi:hypothetical protein